MKQGGVFVSKNLGLGFVLVSLASATVAPAQAQVVYSNDFDTEAGGETAPSYTGFDGLTVTRGTVDVVKNGDFGITCAGGGGSCVDLDGTLFNPGGQLTSGSYAFATGQTTTLAFLMSGNQGGGVDFDSAAASLVFGGGLTGTWGYSVNGTVFDMGSFAAASLVRAYQFGARDPFSDLTLFFTPDTAGTVSFVIESFSNEGRGPVLDNVSLSLAALPPSAVPEPATWAMMILGFGAVGAAIRRRRSVIAVSA